MPKLIRIERPQVDQLRYEFHVRDLEINTPIPEAETALRFPKGLGVHDGAKNVFYLWGDGKPDRTFTLKEYNAWRQEQIQLFKFH